MKAGRTVMCIVILLTFAFQLSLLVEPVRAESEFHWMMTRCRPVDPNNYSVRCGLDGRECSSVVNCSEFPYPD